jgi:hypothetical protein
MTALGDGCKNKVQFPSENVPKYKPGKHFNVAPGVKNAGASARKRLRRKPEKFAQSQTRNIQRKRITGLPKTKFLCLMRDDGDRGCGYAGIPRVEIRNDDFNFPPRGYPLLFPLFHYEISIAEFYAGEILRNFAQPVILFKCFPAPAGIRSGTGNPNQQLRKKRL